MVKPSTRGSIALALALPAVAFLIATRTAAEPSAPSDATAAPAAPAASAATSTADRAAGEEFFEKQIRPLLAARCYACHSNQLDEPKGNLHLDSREGVLRGGDTGAAIVAGDPAKSLLIDAINYRGDYEMPPKGKLPPEEIALLTRWVAMGAPWPAGDKPAASGETKKKFDLAERKASHWAWQPLRATALPAVRNSAWARTAADRYILAKLESQNLAPAAPADRRTLVRRLSFDFLGMPPTPEEVDAYLADDSPDATARLVDRLLAAPAFGERWGRHWLDLMRYAETRGHEFDYIIPNAYEYRDYVIRALNADVPYDAFVTEHLAGDLLEHPREHPTQHFNESIIGTGFWYLHEANHSPVDIRKDETDRNDNAIDVLTKSFIGMTVTCARCHDHKFDAISQRDYYALAGFMQSSDYRQARFETSLHNNRIAAELAKLDADYGPRLLPAIGQQLQAGAKQSAAYLLAAREVFRRGADDQPQNGNETVVFEDFESGNYDGWTATGTAFGDRPQTLETIASYQGRINASGRWFVNSHNVRDGSDITRGDAQTGTLTSRKFTIAHDYITFLIGGGSHKDRTCINLLIDGKPALTATGPSNNQMVSARWDVRKLRGKVAQLQIVDDETGGWGNIGIDDIVFTNVAAAAKTNASPAVTAANYRGRIAEVAKQTSLDAAVLARWLEQILAAGADEDSPLYPWAKLCESRDDARWPAIRDAAIARSASAKQAQSAALAGATVVVDYAQLKSDDWRPDGPEFGPRPLAAGQVQWSVENNRPAPRMLWYGAAERSRDFDNLTLAAGVENDPNRLTSWVRPGHTIRTPKFTINSGRVWALIRGPGEGYAAVDSHRTNDGPLHEQLILHWSDETPGRPRWIGWDLTAYRGHRVCLELSARNSYDFAVLMVVDSDRMPGNPLPAATAASSAATGAASPAEFAKRLEAFLVSSADAFAARSSSALLAAGDQTRTESWVLDHADLFAAAPLASPLAEEFATKRAALVAQIKQPSRTAVAIWEGASADEYLLIRGNPNTQSDAVPRRFLEAISGANQSPITAGSGRLELAKRLLAANNPLASRVIANRLWHHLLGRGIVASTDNFGVLGEAPTHPELLDYLAHDIREHGWSIKRELRTLAASATYQMASTPDAKAAAADPRNLLWHRAAQKRLQGEAIRDAMLRISGRFDTTMFGRSVPVHLTEFLDGRGRPASGPLDGAGRRSVYLAVRRNFLSPMMTAFDTPAPVSAVGRRNSSNVPAQALIMLNDPFVADQAATWAKRSLTAPLTARDRIDLLYRQAFARGATSEEIAAALDFLQTQTKALQIPATALDGDPRPWADLCHVLFNVKEFTFVN